MAKRPKPSETEEDILKQQEEFLASKQSLSTTLASTSKRNHDSMDQNDEKRKKSSGEDKHNAQEEQMDFVDDSMLLLDVREHNTNNLIITAPDPKLKHTAFPAVVLIGKEVKTIKGKSLFSQHVDNMRSTKRPIAVPNADTQKDLKKRELFGVRSNIIEGSGLFGTNQTTDLQSIHDENVEKLSEMTEEEILQEQQALLKSLDPAIVNFLKSKKNTAKSRAGTTNSQSFYDMISSTKLLQNEKEKINDDNTFPIKLSESQNWLHMDNVEYDKMAWMVNSPEANANTAKVTTGYPARFNFEGDLLSRKDEVDTHAGLHHHAEDPEVAGYTLEELLQYSRSTVLQQRVLGLQTIRNIINKTKLGFYDEYLDPPVIPQLLDAGIVLMLRWALDDINEGTREAALQVLRALIVSEADEVCLDRVFSWHRGYETAFLKVKEETKSDMSDKEMTDAELLKMDVIKGLLRTDILPRFCYIIEHIRPSAPNVISILEILIRTARHSLESSYSILNCAKLMTLIMTNFLPLHWNILGTKPIANAYGVPLPCALKLVRVLASSGRNLAMKLATDFHVMDSLLCYISLDPSDETLPTKELLHLILESLFTWRTFLCYNICSTHYIDFFPLLMRQLQYCQQISVMDDHVANYYNYDHGAGLLNLLEAVVHIAASTHYYVSKVKLSTDSQVALAPPQLSWKHISGLPQPISLCAQKWLTELTMTSKYSHNALKLAGCSLEFLATFYSRFAEQPFFQPVEVLEEIELICFKILIPFLGSQTWQNLLMGLTMHSNFLSKSNAGTGRDSPILPSVGSISWGGKVIPILQAETTFHFLSSFMNLVTVVTKLHVNLDTEMLKLILSNDFLIGYLQCICKTENNLIGNWFTRYETYFLYFIINLVTMKKPNVETTCLILRVALALLPQLIDGDGRLMYNLLSSVLFNEDFWMEDEVVTQLASLSLGIDFPYKLSDGASGKLEPKSTPPKLSKILPLIRETYLGIFEKTYSNISKHINSKVFPSERNNIAIANYPASLISIDWPYLPIKQAFFQTFKQDNTNHTKTTFQENNIVHCLQWLCSLENWRPEAMKNIKSASKYCYFGCMFLIANNLFFDDKIRTYLEELFIFLVKAEQMQHLNTKILLPFATAFRDFYLQLLNQFAAVSYGDHLFGLLIMLPLQQHYDCQLRKDVWIENSIILRLLSFSTKEFPLSMEHYLNPAEENKDLLTAYYQALYSGAVEAKQNPVLYIIAVHHIHNFLYLSNSLHPKMKTAMQKHLNEHCNETVKYHIISYAGLCSESKLGFKLLAA